MMKVPLKFYLLEPSERLKVFAVEGDVIRTPVDINIACLSNKYGFNPIYDRFRFWSTMHSFEDKHFYETKPSPISPLIPVRLVIRKLNAEEDWMVDGHIWAEGSFQFLCNDDHVALQFVRDVFEDTPPNFGTSFNIKSSWKNEKGLIDFFTATITGALDWFFGVEENKAKFSELYDAFLKYIKSLSVKKGAKWHDELTY